MPSVVAESDLFPATLQRPNNGELADAASILLYLQGVANRQRWTYNRMRTRWFDVTQKYGAVAGTSDSTAAIQAAIDDAAGAVGCGDVFLPGEFRATGLTIHPGVNLRGVPGLSRLNHNHATNNALTWSGNSRQNLTEITGLSFSAAIDSTGHVIDVPSGNLARLKLSNCAFNDEVSGGAFKGRLVFSQGADGFISAEDCYVRGVGNASADLFFVAGAGSVLHLQDSRLVMPAVYSSKLIEMDDGRFLGVGNDFDITANTSGTTPAVLSFLSLGYHVLKGNVFRGAFSSAPCVFTASGGVKLSETGSVFDTVNAYALGGTLALGSELTLQNPIATTILSGSIITCATGYRAQSFNHHGTAPTVVLPDILFIDQEFDLTVYNNSGSGWAGIALASAIGGLAGSVPTGQARTFKLKALDIKATGSPFWVCMGDVSSAVVVP